MTIIRWILGRIILLLEFFFTSKGPQFNAVQQEYIDQEAKLLTLYEFKSCPFCVKVRMHAAKLGLPIARRDVKINVQWLDELMSGGKKHKVPCLRIEESPNTYRWLYESSDINQYLTDRFDSAGLAQATA